MLNIIIKSKTKEAASEAFSDLEVSDFCLPFYLQTYQMTARELASKISRNILASTGLVCAYGGLIEPISSGQEEETEGNNNSST